MNNNHRDNRRLPILVSVLVDVHYCRVNVESNMTYYVRAEFAGGSIGVPSYPSLGVMDSEAGAAAIKNLKRVALSQ